MNNEQWRHEFGFDGGGLEWSFTFNNVGKPSLYQWTTPTPYSAWVRDLETVVALMEASEGRE